MRKLFQTCLIFYFLSVACQAQQRPQYTQYIFNNYLLNPAISGIEDYIDVKAGYRSQWRGFEGAPVTNYVSVHSPVSGGYIRSNVNSFAGNGDNPMSRSYLKNYSAADPHHGVGLTMVMDKAGLFKYFNANVTYAYHLGLSPELNLSAGVSAGVSNTQFDVSQVTLGESIDPAILYGNTTQTSPDLGLGVWMYGSRYFVGLSAQQLLSNKIIVKSSDDAYNLSSSVPHYFATAGYKSFLGEEISLITSLMIKTTPPIPASLDVNLKLAFKDQFWIGASCRFKDSYSGLLGLNINHLLNISYSYDFITSDIKKVSNNSHEIILGLLLKNRYKVTCPRRSW